MIGILTGTLHLLVVAPFRVPAWLVLPAQSVWRFLSLIRLVFVELVGLVPVGLGESVQPADELWRVGRLPMDLPYPLVFD